MQIRVFFLSVFTSTENSHTWICALLRYIILRRPLARNFITTTIARNWKRIGKRIFIWNLNWIATKFDTNLLMHLLHNKHTERMWQLRNCLIYPSYSDAIEMYGMNGRHCYLVVDFILLNSLNKSEKIFYLWTIYINS